MMTNPGSVPCLACGGEPVVALERPGLFGYASGAPSTCPDCLGSGVAKCFWRLECRGLPATQPIEGRPACEGCAAVLDCEIAAGCGLCGDGEPVAMIKGVPACERCVDTTNEIANADTLPPPAPEDDRAEAALVELCTAVLA